MLPKPGQSSYRDRTQEFLSVAERLRKSSNASPSNNSSAITMPMIENLRWRFSQNSTKGLQRSSMGSTRHHRSWLSSPNLSNVWRVDGDVMGVVAIEILVYGCGCISVRGGVAKRTSVFDDPTLEIQELTAVVKQDISALNSALVDLQFLCNSQNESGNISSDTTTHSTTVVENLKNRLMGATKEFKKVLTMRAENLKVHENRRQLFSSTASKESTNPFIRQRPLASRSAAEASTTPPPPLWANGSTSSSQLFPSKPADGESQPLLQHHHHQQ
ncbi:hypothetical protein Pint_13117 [Pistacia integerrima]|uniref:Uncharacterized protein n=1 Tax=Pistacia integerrima TaxID=434235 RepID=A0ACC0YBL9_9ROSI|nr:hypothetical protein Pint_13117 [Pistacia integerrima]